MSAPNTATQQRETLRQGVLAILQRLAEQGRALELPAPSPALAEYRQRLTGDGYTVLVVGEAKRGKSTLVNAVIGQSILPTDVEIATSQVFRISHADQPAFRLRFEDGSQQVISADDLPRYGSQALADTEGAPRLDQLIRWIEVELPAQFLPPQMALLDTPGLGSLYAPHAQVTQRFVPHADAVIFTLDSGRPVGQQDLEFIEAILKVTRNIFFIQTMIDLYGRDHWQEMQRRNQNILMERFGDRLVDARVWPISSTLLLKGAQTGDDDYVLVSKQKDLMAALQTFLFRVSGLNRFAEALAVADGYYRLGGKALAARLAALKEGSAGQQNGAQQQAAQRKQQFEAEWGERGQKRNELREGIRRAITMGKQGFTQALQPGGDIATAQEARIDALKTVQEANQFGEAMAGEVISAVAGTWQQVCAQVQARCLDQLRPFAESVEALDTQQDLRLSAIDPGKAPPEFRDDWWIRIRGAYSSASVMIGIAHFIPPLMPLVPIAALWAIARGGWKDTSNTQVRAAQQELRRHLGVVLQRVRQHFLNIDLATGRYSLVDEFFNEVERAMLDQIQAIVRQHAEQAQAEVARLAANARLDEQQRAQQATRLQQALQEWEGSGRAIQAMVAELKGARQPAPASGAPA
jgi:GTPase SAR1 family protein